MLGWGQRRKRLPSSGLLGLLYLFMPREGDGRGAENHLTQLEGQTEKGQQVQLLWHPTSRGREDPSSLLEKSLLPIPWPPAVALQGLATHPCIPELLPHAAVTSHQETSACCLPATASTPQPAWAMPSVWAATWSSTENPQSLSSPAVTPWYFPGRGNSRTTEVSVSPQGWAAEIDVLGLSQCAVLHSQFFLPNAGISNRVGKSVTSTDLALLTAANMGNHLSISNSH